MPPAENQAWVARAESDKACYLHELTSYFPPQGFDAKGNMVAANIPGVKAPRKLDNKVERDLYVQKCNVSDYFLYQNTMRSQFKLRNPGMMFGQVAKYTSHMYNNLAQEETAPWDTHTTTQDKPRYDTEMAN